MCKVMMTTLKYIEEYASAAHLGQKRKYTGEPYVVHPIAVSTLVRENGGTFEMQAAALLHDVIEDTLEDADDIDLFLKSLVDKSDCYITHAQADTILAYVVELTDVYTTEDYPDLNRKQRKALECARLAKVSYQAKMIKSCDIKDNSLTILEHDPKFAKVFLEEKEALRLAMYPEFNKSL
tara:strand:+ start:158 stop:697 length:540 start_codon:yes stop_codon:yes gene_type:complete